MRSFISLAAIGIFALSSSALALPVENTVATTDTTDTTADVACDERDRSCREREWERDYRRHRDDRNWERDHPRPHWRRDVATTDSTDATADVACDERDHACREQEWEREHQRHRDDRNWEHDHPRPHWRRDVATTDSTAATAAPATTDTTDTTDATADVACDERDRSCREREWERDYRRHRDDRNWERATIPVLIGAVMSLRPTLPRTQLPQTAQLPRTPQMPQTRQPAMVIDTDMTAAETTAATAASTTVTGSAVTDTGTTRCGLPAPRLLTCFTKVWHIEQ